MATFTHRERAMLEDASQMLKGIGNWLVGTHHHTLSSEDIQKTLLGIALVVDEILTTGLAEDLDAGESTWLREQLNTLADEGKGA